KNRAGPIPPGRVGQLILSLRPTVAYRCDAPLAPRQRRQYSNCRIQRARQSARLRHSDSPTLGVRTMGEYMSLINRILFVSSLVLGGLAAWEKIANLFGYTVLQGMYEPWRLMDFAGLALLYVIALQLREIRYALVPKGRP